MAEWIKIEDRLPEGDDMKLVYAVTKNGTGSVNRAWFDGKTWHGSGSMAGVTHWMELPEPPDACTQEDAPVRHGKWLPGGNFTTEDKFAICSRCDEGYEIGTEPLEVFAQFYKYCPNCGAKMDQYWRMGRAEQ